MNDNERNNLTILEENTYIDIDDIAKVLISLSDIPAINIGELTNALYQLKAIAQNKYNSDYYRILYNTLLIIADKNL